MIPKIVLYRLQVYTMCVHKGKITTHLFYLEMNHIKYSKHNTVQNGNASYKLPQVYGNKKTKCISISFSR